MKKFLIALVMIIALLIPHYAIADCTVTVTLNVSSDPNAATQEIWYDPDNTVAGNEIIPPGCSGDMTLTGCPFTITAPAPNDEVYVITKNGDGSDAYQSPSMPVGGLVGSVTTTIVTQCQ
jgi:hypothetical protein